MSSMPTAKKGQPKKTFYVAENVRMGDPSGSNKILGPGDPVKLTKEQAEYCLNRPTRLINVELPDFNEPDAPSSDDDQAEDSAEHQADGSGDKADGRISSTKNAQAEGARVPRRKAAAL